jgi:hypothetical protein
LHNIHDFSYATLMATSRWFREEFVQATAVTLKTCGTWSCSVLPLAPSLRRPRQIAANASALIDDHSRLTTLPMTCIWDRHVRPPTHLETVVRTSDIVSS